MLADFGWESVRRQHNQTWAITEEEVEVEGHHTPLSASSASLSSEPHFITLPAVTVDQGSPKAPVLLRAKPASSGGSFIELSSETRPNGDVLHGSPVHVRSCSDPVPRPSQQTEGAAAVSLLRKPPVGEVRDERSSSSGSKSESFESSGVCSLDSTAPGLLLTPIPSVSSSMYSLDAPCATNHPSDVHRKLAKLRQMALRRPSHLVLSSTHNESVRGQPLTSPRDLAGYARLRQLKQQRAASNTDLEAKAAAVAPHLWEEKETNFKKPVLRLSSRARSVSASRTSRMFICGSRVSPLSG